MRIRTLCKVGDNSHLFRHTVIIIILAYFIILVTGNIKHKLLLLIREIVKHGSGFRRVKTTPAPVNFFIGINRLFSLIKGCEQPVFSRSIGVVINGALVIGIIRDIDLRITFGKGGHQLFTVRCVGIVIGRTFNHTVAQVHTHCITLGLGQFLKWSIVGHGT